MNNKNNVLYLKPNKSYSYVLLLLISILLFVMSFLLFTYDYYKTVGFVTCEEKCSVSILLPYDKTFIIERNNSVYFDDASYEFKYDYGDSEIIDNSTPLQEVLLYTDYFSEKKIVEVKFKYNKQRIINKIINYIREG